MRGSPQALQNLLEQTQVLQIDIESQIAAWRTSNRMEGQLSIKDKIESPQENSTTEPQNKDKEITVLEEGEIDSSALEWEEDFSPKASIIMDIAMKGLEKTTSSMKEPNIETKGKRGRKSRKTLLKIAGSANGQTKLNVGKGDSLP